VAFALNIQSVEYSGIRVNYLLFLIPGIIAAGTYNFFGRAFATTRLDNATNFLTILAVSNVSTLTYVMAKIVSYFTILTLQSFYLFFLCYIMTGYTVSFFKIVAILVLILLGVSFWSTIGIILGVRIRDELTRDLIFTVTGITVIVASSVYYPLDNGPTWLKFVAGVNPLSYIANCIRDIFLDITPRLEDVAGSMAILAVTVLLLTYLTKRGYLPRYYW
jgi:ABC-2 type transport system permease protein